MSEWSPEIDGRVRLDERSGARLGFKRELEGPAGGPGTCHAVGRCEWTRGDW